MKSNSYIEYPYRYQHKTPKQSPDTESSKSVQIQTKNNLSVFIKFCECHYLVQTMNNLNFSQACLVDWMEKREDCRERVAGFELRQRQREEEMRREEIEERRGWIVKVEGMEMFLDHKWIEFIADIPKAIFYTL